MKNLLFLAIPILFFSCKREMPKSEDTNGTNTVNSIFEMNVPDGFRYESSKDYSFQIKLLNTKDQSAGRQIVELWTDLPENGGKRLFKGLSGLDGNISFPLKIASKYSSLVLNTSFLGIPENLIINLNNNNINLVLGGSAPLKLETKNPIFNFSGVRLQKSLSKISNKMVPTWNADGVPNNLLSPKDVVPNQLVNDIWSMLPSRVAVPTTYPELLNDSITKRTIVLTKRADVFVTFITEGAGFRNTLFYYRYNKNNPPATAAAIDTLFLIFPNASLKNSNGGLLTGDKVYIGTFGADTVIEYGIISHGYDINTGTIGAGNWFLYGNKNFNPEPNPAIKQHMVMLFDNVGQRYIMGFEDIIRTASGCDHDFNDVLFYTTANPLDAISDDDIAVLPPADDTDGDGVKDVDDEYPTDAARAFNNYYPSINTSASVSFEDLWPYYGDYDMNDVMVDFRYKIVTNASNAVKDVQGNYTLRASGGQIDNSFAVEFPTLRSNVQNFTGAVLEAGQNNTVAKIISNIRSLQSRWNTIPADPISDTLNYSLSFSLINPVAISTFGLNEYNPFIWGNDNGKNRSKEIHLPGKTPTSLAADSLFGTGNDRTSRTNNKYYLSEHNLPWAILTPERFDYPIERVDIVTAHLKFASWAQSNGTLFPDWYKANSGYRDNTKIYNKP
jgi:LruC domain-containing protein